jgi:hypothetical protein
MDCVAVGNCDCVSLSRSRDANRVCLDAAGIGLTADWTSITTTEVQIWRSFAPANAVGTVQNSVVAFLRCIDC